MCPNPSKLSLLLMGTIVALTLLAGCGGEPTPDPAAAAAATIIGQALSRNAPVSITVSFVQPLSTPTPDRAATQTAEVRRNATSVPATVTAAPIATNTPLSTRNWAATQTAEAGRIATSVAATLTAAPIATKTPVPTPNLAATQTVESHRVATAVAATLTVAAPAQPPARAGNFAACLDECATDRSNAQRSFPEGVTKLHVVFEYANFPPGARYQRIWRMPGRGEWVRYDCIWPGPESGVTEVTLTEPNGLHSGAWEMTLILNGEVLLREQIFVEGAWSAWYPAGSFDGCFGKRSTR